MREGPKHPHWGEYTLQKVSNSMFGLHAWDLLIVLAIVLLLFGARRLPQMGNALGQTIQLFKKGVNGLSEEEKGDKAPPELPEKTASDK